MRVLIDTDPGIDDALALMLALRSPELEVVGVTIVHGNVDLERGTANAFKVLDVMGRRDVPVAPGAAAPLLRELRTAEIVHGQDGLADLVTTPVDVDPRPIAGPAFIVETLQSSDEPVTLVTLGPLTNVAIALSFAPEIVQRIERIVAMGGAVRSEGNATPAAEFNVLVDPEAAEIVLRSAAPITLVPLDVTMKAIFRDEWAERLRGSSDHVERFAGNMAAFVIRVYREYYRIAGMALHDPLAMAVAIDPSLVETQALFVTVDRGEGISTGRTVADFWHIPESWGQPNADVALAVDAERFLALFSNRMFGRYPP
jgi:inosine-uridine nucleoside N-ribohydrolase